MSTVPTLNFRRFIDHNGAEWLQQLHETREGRKWIDVPVVYASQEIALEPLFASPPDQSARIAEQAKEIADLHARLAEAVEVLNGVDDDFMTSENHHPNYVLIPVTKFDQLRDAAQFVKEQER